MPTQADIEDKEPIDIRVRVVGELDCTSSKMASRIEVQDTRGNTFPFTVWNNNALSDFAWEEGQWYDLENARGNVYGGRRSLNGSSRLEATPVEGPNEATETEGTTQTHGSLTDGLPYLSLFPLDRDFEKFTVNKYHIKASSTFDQDPMDATYSLAAYLRKNSPAAVTHAGTMSVVSTSPLDIDLPNPFALTNEQSVDLHATEKSDRETLTRLLQIQLKEAIDGTSYRTDRINRIVTQEPVVENTDGLFEACRAYGLRVEALSTGAVFVGVEVAHHARSRVTLDEYVEQTGIDIDELVGTNVEHDPDQYDVSGNGTFQGYAEERFTDPLPDLGNQSLADWYEQQGRVPGDTLADLQADNPRLVNVQYNPTDEETRVHVPHLLRVSPRKEIVKRIAPSFHQRWDRTAKLLPNERFSLATEFVAHLDDLPEVDTTVDPRPVGPSRSFLTTQIDRTDNLQFGDGKLADVPSRGLKRHGVYKRPESFHVHYLVPERYADGFEGFRGELEGQLKRIGCGPDGVTYDEYHLGTNLEYTQVMAAVADTGPDAVLAIVPSPTNEFVQDGTIDDPYGEFKKALGRQSIPSQMVVAENLDDQWVHRNTALGLVAGAGGVPWRVDEMPGDADCFVGLDATRDPDTGQFLGASANVVRADGTVFISKSQSLQSGETFDEDAIVDVVKDVHREFVRREGDSPDHIVIHRDGRLFEDAAAITKPFENAGIDFDILDIRKSGAPRAAYYEDGEFRIDEKGRLFIEQSGDYGFLTTTGRPEFNESDGLGTPRALRVVRRAGDTDIQTLLEQIYWLSESHVGSAQRSIRLPVSTYYADRCADHARKGYLLNGELLYGIPYL